MKFILIATLAIFCYSSLAAQDIAEDNPSSLGDTPGLRVNGKIQADVLAAIWNRLSPEERNALMKEMNEQMNLTGSEIQSARDLLDQRLEEMSENSGGPVVRPATPDETVWCDATVNMHLMSTGACGLAVSNGVPLPAWKPGNFRCTQVARFGRCEETCEFLGCARP